MDAFFVDVKQQPYSYFFVEAKSSVLPTPASSFSGHRHGILRKMIDSFTDYEEDDQRFDYTVIRDNLEQSGFTAEQRTRIREDLIPPGPAELKYVGAAITNQATVNGLDDDFILSEPCVCPFTFRSLIVSDLAVLADEAYRLVHTLGQVGR
jgi:hypothetical protein